MKKTQLNAAIKKLPGEHVGWWHADGEEAFQRIGARLVEKGFTQEEAADLLSEAYAAVAGEFGG